MGMGPTWLGRRQVLDQEPGLGHAPVRKFRDSDHFKCDLVCQPGVSLLLPGLDRMEGRKPSQHTERGPPLFSCSTDVRPGPALVPEAVGGRWRFQRWKDCPARPPRLGKSLMQRRHVRCHRTVCTGPHSLSVRWRSMLPLYRGENRLRAGKRLAQSHSQSAERRGQWTRLCLGLLPAQGAAAPGFRASRWLGLFPDLDSEPRHSCTLCLK